MSYYPQQAQPPTSGTNQKPTLTGVRIKQRKGAAKATAKFEPETFRDALLLHLNSLPPKPSVEALVQKLVLAGTTLELLKYSEQFFELLFVGGLLQPGGSFLDDKRSPVSVFGAGEDGADWKQEVKDIVEVLKKVIQRYKYMQKPLEETFLPGILQYIPKYDDLQREKLAFVTARLICEGQANAKCFQSLAKDQVVKDDCGLNFITVLFKYYLTWQPMDHLSSNLRKSGLKDLLDVFPQPVRDRAHLEKHFKASGLTPVSDWYSRKMLGAVKEDTVANIGRMIGEEESADQIVEYLRAQQQEKPVADSDLVEWIWLGIMQSIDWSARPDQIEGNVVKEVTRYTPVLEPFCNGAKAEVGLINAVQVYCYTDTRIIKAFVQILKVLYNTDCVSDQAIIYWATKGAKPQGKQHFLKATEALVKFLQEQESDDDDE